MLMRTNGSHKGALFLRNPFRKPPYPVPWTFPVAGRRDDGTRRREFSRLWAVYLTSPATPNPRTSKPVSGELG